MSLTLVLSLVIPLHYLIYRKKKKVIKEGLFSEFYAGIKTKRWISSFYMFFFIL